MLLKSNVIFDIQVPFCPAPFRYVGTTNNRLYKNNNAIAITVTSLKILCMFYHVITLSRTAQY